MTQIFHCAIYYQIMIRYTSYFSTLISAVLLWYVNSLQITRKKFNKFASPLHVWKLKCFHLQGALPPPWLGVLPCRAKPQTPIIGLGSSLPWAPTIIRRFTPLGAVSPDRKVFIRTLVSLLECTDFSDRHKVMCASSRLNCSVTHTSVFHT